MHITVSGKQVELSDALRTRVGIGLDNIAGKYFEHAIEAHVTFSRSRANFVCDINLHAGRGLQLRGEGEAAEANGAFDHAAEHVAKRLRRYRRRVNEHHRDLAHRQSGAAARLYVLKADEEEVEEQHTHPAVIAEMQTEIGVLSVSEAAMRLDLAAQTVLMFRNSGSGEYNVIYRRPDGNLGWIEPTR